MGVKEWLIANKFFVFCVIAAASFCISTIALGVSNSNLRSELQKQQGQDGEGRNHSTATLMNATDKPYIMSKYRLPSTVRPKKYDLYFYPNLDTGSYGGKVVVTLNILKSTDVITLNSKGLSIKNAKVDGEEATASLDEQYELLNLRKKSGKDIDEKNSVIEIEFEGSMKNKLVGLYRSTYKGAKGLR
ncbi:hypothetical protein WA026_009220 [Henosepilachna vigintioctopunctata]|uniref:Aminopeptidase N-like N-terminal domain-containing protein n=1 Tax=Henosepilachna vigintioctopunctata TaxID=420089 RepID=A0AAW1UYD6_9CUCU